MTRSIPSHLYQTRSKRLHYVEHGQSMYGKLGAAGPAISLITGEVLKEREPKKLKKGSSNDRKTRLEKSKSKPAMDADLQRATPR